MYATTSDVTRDIAVVAEAATGSNLQNPSFNNKKEEDNNIQNSEA